MINKLSENELKDIINSKHTIQFFGHYSLFFIDAKNKNIVILTLKGMNKNDDGLENIKQEIISADRTGEFYNIIRDNRKVDEIEYIIIRTSSIYLEKSIVHKALYNFDKQQFRFENFGYYTST